LSFSIAIPPFLYQFYYLYAKKASSFAELTFSVPLNNMAFLQNYDRMYHVGRTFGTINSNGNLLPCRTLFGAFGNPVSLSPEFLNAENPYTV